MTPFQVVTDQDLLKATLFNRAKLAENGCWEWTRTKRAGYGLMYLRGRNVSSHRVSYELHHGPIPAGLVVRHRCDNPSCINPDHLLLGTQKDNAADREARNRRDVRGEQVGTAKLTEVQVLEIKRSNKGLKQLAHEYGVDKSNVWAIRAGKTWAHLNIAQAA